MYNTNFVRKLVTKYLSSSRASWELMKFLRKSDHDLRFLFQNSQRGWNLFKKMAKSRPWTEIVDEGLVWINVEAAVDFFWEMFFTDVIEADAEGRLIPGEIDYLTKFFERVIIKDAPRSIGGE